MTLERDAEIALDFPPICLIMYNLAASMDQLTPVFRPPFCSAAGASPATHVTERLAVVERSSLSERFPPYELNRANGCRRNV